MLVETARLWADLGFYADDGQFHVHGVTGPDEYTTVVNDNTYTNLMARINLNFAVDAVRRLHAERPAAHAALVADLELREDELDEWERAAAAMHVPYDERRGIHPQDTGFLDREVWDLEATPADHFPLRLHYHPLEIYRHQVIKQADIVLAMFLLGDQFDAEQKRANYDYYDRLTSGDSSLSACVQSIVASEVGNEEHALAYFRFALLMDLADVAGNASDGVHIASAAGVWQALVFGFGGVRDFDGALSITPRLPTAWALAGVLAAVRRPPVADRPHARRGALPGRGRRPARRDDPRRAARARAGTGARAVSIRSPRLSARHRADTARRGRPLPPARGPWAARPWLCGVSEGETVVSADAAVGAPLYGRRMEASGLPSGTRARLGPLGAWRGASVHLRWFAAGATVAFAVPYLGTSVFDLRHDVYLGLYMTVVVMLLVSYVRAAGVDVRAVVGRHWIASVLSGLVLLAPLVANVLSEDGTPRPSGAYFVFELVWRGGLYGAVDALLLTAFPCMVVLSAFGGRLAGWRRKAGYVGASLALVMTITATYHLGYAQFREDGVGGPETGNVLMSVPALLTTNPVGSLIDHAAMHITAVAHEYETELRLPPQADAED
jgi:Glycosyl hydrolase family 65 central catalytic domain